MDSVSSDSPERDQDRELHIAYKRARLLGLVLCVAWPLALMVMVGRGVIRPGENSPQGVIKQLGYTFTALTFFAAAFVTYRSGKVLKGFKDLDRAKRPGVIFRESLLYAALFELSCLYGLLYWTLVGRNAYQHVLVFMALSPLMFFFFVPRFDAWKLALGDRDGEN
jgi:hypothetical protein